MLDYRQILTSPEKYQELLKRRGFELPLNKIQELNSQRSSIIRDVEELRRQLNTGSKEIGGLQRKKADPQEIETLKSQMTAISQTIAQKEVDLPVIESALEALMLEIPNVPAEHTPIGTSDEDNPALRHWGTKPLFDFSPKNHYELGETMGIIDFERGTKLSGTRFTILKGAASRLERAIMNFLYDLAINEHGYLPVSVPFMVNRNAMKGTGQLPKFEFDMFKVTAGEREWFLIPTAEVPVTNIHADEVLAEKDLPINYCSLTPCFRAEAGSSGRDVKGLIRQHQFEKLEMVKISKPEDSWKELDIMTSHAEDVLQKLGLHYRVVALCTGDIGFSAQFTYDLEVWLPGQNAYREISSCSNFGDFQARRAKIRYKKEQSGKNEIPHTLNGSAMPIGRTLVAVMEQYQRADGSIEIPSVLQRYTNFSKIFPDGQVS